MGSLDGLLYGTDKRGAVGEAAQVLLVGGGLVVCDVMTSPRARGSEVDGVTNRNGFPSLETQEAFEEMCEAAGLVVAQTQHLGSHVSLSYLDVIAELTRRRSEQTDSG